MVTVTPRRQYPRGQKHGGRQSSPRNLTIAWVNVGKAMPAHVTALHIAFEKRIDVVHIQEPWTGTPTRTQTHPGYEIYSPVEGWSNRATWERERPRALTYVRKGNGYKVQQRRPILSRDLVWVEVNGYTMLNIYRQPWAKPVLEYILELTPPTNCIVGGDFNCRNDMFEPGVKSENGGDALAEWSRKSGMDYTGTPGAPTHEKGSVIDLVFSNIAFADTKIEEDMSCGSDHVTQVTTIPTRSHTSSRGLKYSIPEDRLPYFKQLMKLKIVSLPKITTIHSSEELDKAVKGLEEAFQEAMGAAGRARTGEARGTPWWTEECEGAKGRYQRALNRNEETRDRRREFYTAVRKAKREYWRRRIDEIKEEKDLYTIINWHTQGSMFKSPLLEHEGKTYETIEQKAELLREKILQRFDIRDDLEEDPLTGMNVAQEGLIPWDTHVSMEEVEANTIKVSSTSPGVDQITVKLLKNVWEDIREYVRGLFQESLARGHFPTPWKKAEVAMIPKVGKKDRASVRSYRPIALLSCLGKGLERIVAKRIAWLSLERGLISPQHCGALPKRSAMDLITCFTHDVEAALAEYKCVSLLTGDVQGAFDALLPRRALARMKKMGFTAIALRFIASFWRDRQIRVRFEGHTTDYTTQACGTRQGSPLSPVLYLLYLAELLLQNPTLRFGYADDIALYQISRSLDANVKQLAKDMREVRRWGAENKVVFAPEKYELIHITRGRSTYAPTCIVDKELRIKATTTAPGPKTQPAVRWLGVWFDKKFTFKRHVAERCRIAAGLAKHIRNLARIKDGPPANSLRKAMIACVLPAALYGCEAWYTGIKKTARRRGRGQENISARAGGMIETIDKIFTTAMRGVLPVWKTTPNLTLYRDAGIPSAFCALEQAKHRFALRLQTVDGQHPLVRRIACPIIVTGQWKGQAQCPKTQIQRLGKLLPSVPRPVLQAPRYTPGSGTDPTNGMTKEDAAKAFKEWFRKRSPRDLCVFSDGSELVENGTRRVGYGYIVYRGQESIVQGRGALGPLSHVFDAEAIGAYKGLQRAVEHYDIFETDHIWSCVDSTSAIWGLRGTPPDSSQWAFRAYHKLGEETGAKTKWCPGHQDIKGNEIADKLAKAGAMMDPTEEMRNPTLSGIRSIIRKLNEAARKEWWDRTLPRASRRYRDWDPDYNVKEPPALALSRPILHRYLAIRTGHGDFAWYHKRQGHDNANLYCSCGRKKTPNHLVWCRKLKRTFKMWPDPPRAYPRTRNERLDYLRSLLEKPSKFQVYLEVTGFYDKICPT